MWRASIQRDLYIAVLRSEAGEVLVDRQTQRRHVRSHDVGQPGGRAGECHEAHHNGAVERGASSWLSWPANMNSLAYRLHGEAYRPRRVAEAHWPARKDTRYYPKMFHKGHFWNPETKLDKIGMLL